MRKESAKERAAWTAHIDGSPVARPSKYGNERAGKFDSKYEAGVAVKLEALASCGQIRNLDYQVPVTLVEGRGKIRPIKYFADFRYTDLEGNVHWLDAKGVKTPIFRLKKKLASLLLNIEIEEV
jgi:hypothetical protein